MSEIRRNLEQVWEQLRGQQPQRTDVLEEVIISGLRGINGLRVSLPFPVSVLAGPNGCGKSTVLFALACAYRDPAAGVRDYTPASLFPEFRPKSGSAPAMLADPRGRSALEFAYVSKSRREQMRWARDAANWNRSYFGRPGGKQPERAVYLRTLANLTNPSELRTVLQINRRPNEPFEVDSSLIAFAQRILSYRYVRLTRFAAGPRDLLFAERQADSSDAGSVSYSEFHMSAGERALLRLSLDLSKLRNALVLIDEVEAGLHPYVQQVLMLELQRLALRNHLQIVVTTHSLAILETVPPEARIFLERTGDNVVKRETHRDIMQRALYGGAQDRLLIICEDEEAEGIVRGVFDFLGSQLDLLQNDIEVGRDSGKQEFPNHARTLGRIRRLSDVIFVLDGDGADFEARIGEVASGLGQQASVAVLPGKDAPEAWAWDIMKKYPRDHAGRLGLDEVRLGTELVRLDGVYSSATDKPSNIAKNKLGSLAEGMSRAVPDLLRSVAFVEAGKRRGQLFELVNRLSDLVSGWRTRTRR